MKEKEPYHVTVIWPDGRGPRDPTLAELERAKLAETVEALAKIAESMRDAPRSTDLRWDVPTGGPRFRVEQGDDWRDVVASIAAPPRDCIEEDVVREVLRSDVAEARAICRRHLMSTDSGLSDDWIVAYLTECVTGSFATRALLDDYHALSLRVLPRLIREAGDASR